MKRLILIIASLLLTSSSLAQVDVPGGEFVNLKMLCSKPQTILRAIEEYKESPFLHIPRSDAVITLWLNESTETSTLTFTYPEGIMCLVADGKKIIFEKKPKI